MIGCLIWKKIKDMRHKQPLPKEEWMGKFLPEIKKTELGDAMKDLSTAQMIRIINSYVWIVLIGIQDIFFVSVLLSKSNAGALMGFAAAGPVFFSLPILVLSIIDIAKKDFLWNSLIIFTITDIFLIITYAVLSALYSLIGFLGAAFAEGAGDLPYAIAVNYWYMIGLPIVSLVSIIVLIVTAVICNRKRAVKGHK